MWTSFVQLIEIYSDDFSYFDKKDIKNQLEIFIFHVRRLEFRVYHDLASLPAKMVELDT